MAVVSPDDPDPHERVTGWRYLEADNKPLGKKWNAGMKVMNALGVDAVMIVGSDDLVSTSYIDRVMDLLRRGIETVSCRDLYVYVPPEQRVAYVESMTPGAGRVLTRSALDYLRWKPWQDDIDAHLDSSVMHRIRQAPIKRNKLRNMSKRNWAVLDIKQADQPQMWRLINHGNGHHTIESPSGTEMNIRRVVYIPAAQFFRDHFPSIREFTRLGTPEDVR